ncbi:MAG: efflux RND transporter periplasmic adaptor subunit [Spirochaetales bacterium]|nr:efflux RND transporter periplasmic adaptor subunit [Spirochaetales bacterium]
MKNQFFKYTFLIAVLVLFSCNNKTSSSISKTSTTVDIQQVIAISPEVSEYAPVINSFGSLTFTQKTDITSPADGKITSIRVEEGDIVKAGEIIAVIDNIQLLVQKKQMETAVESSLAQLKLAQTELEEGQRQIESRFLGLNKSVLSIQQKELELDNAKKEYKKKKELLDIDGASKSEVEKLEISIRGIETDYKNLLADYEIAQIGFRDQDLLNTYGMVPNDKKARREKLIELNTRTLSAQVEVAEANVASSRSQLESVELLIDEMSVKSPYSGIVGARYIEEGERIKTGDQILTTFKRGSVYAEFPVQEGQITQIYTGMPVSITIPSVSLDIFKAKIAQISPTIDPQSGNINVKALISDSDSKFKPGMFFKVEINTNEVEEQLLIPDSSVFDKNDSSARVFVIKNNRVFSKTINLGNSSEGKICITNGLSLKDVIVDEPPRLLRDGMEVSYEIEK